MKLQCFLLYGITAFSALLISQQTLAHGESNPGPHGGFIRMPGAFHTEVIPEKKGLKIMLLDINFEHPTIQQSSIKATITSGNNTLALKCKTQGEAFFCPASEHALQNGTLTIAAIRQKAEGAVAEYPLPLQWENEQEKIKS